MARNKLALNVYVKPELMARLDDWIASQDAPWTKTAIVERAVEAFLDARSNLKEGE